MRLRQIVGWWREDMVTLLLEVVFWLRPTRADLPPYPHREGKFARFEQRGHAFNQPYWTVVSQRGSFELGWIEWSPQWGAYSFRAHPESRFNGQLVAEIYAFLKERGQATGRFV